MELTCEPCAGTGVLEGDVTCTYCNGNGKVDLTDPEFKHMPAGPRRALQGLVWSMLLTTVADLQDKVNDVIDKCNDIFEKVNKS